MLILTEVRQVQPGAAPQGAVVALQQPVEAADHSPFQSLQQDFSALAQGRPSAA